MEEKKMKKIFCILSLVFGALCLVFGVGYATLLIMELVKKLRATKEVAMQKIRDFVSEQ